MTIDAAKMLPCFAHLAEGGDCYVPVQSRDRAAWLYFVPVRVLHHAINVDAVSANAAAPSSVENKPMRILKRSSSTAAVSASACAPAPSPASETFAPVACAAPSLSPFAPVFAPRPVPWASFVHREGNNNPCATTTGGYESDDAPSAITATDGVDDLHQELRTIHARQAILLERVRVLEHSQEADDQTLRGILRGLEGLTVKVARAQGEMSPVQAALEDLTTQIQRRL